MRRANWLICHFSEIFLYYKLQIFKYEELKRLKDNANCIFIDIHLVKFTDFISQALKMIVTLAIKEAYTS